MKRSLGKILFASILTLILFTTISLFTAFAAETEIDGVVWKYNINEEDKTITITGMETSLEKTASFNIPKGFEFEGEEGIVLYPVVAINGNAFANNKKVFGKLTIPDTVTTIGESAFQGTYIVGDVVIPESVTSIGKKAFYCCFGITSVTLPSSVTAIEESTFYACHSLTSINTENIISYGRACFFDCRSLLEIKLAPSVESIGSIAFAQCYSLHGKYDLSGVKSISLDAFKNCTRITSFVIPSIDVDILPLFTGCTSLESIETKNNPKYTSVNGVLFSGAGNNKTLVHYPTAKKDIEYTIPSNVSTIGIQAFMGNSSIEKIYIGANVTAINDQAFSGTNLKNVYIPASVTLIGDKAFESCKKLEWVVLDVGIAATEMDTFKDANADLVLYAKNDLLSRPAHISYFVRTSEAKCTNHRYGYLDVKPTCDAYGYNQCVICGSLAYIKELGHIGPIIETSTLTCTTDQYSIVDCTICHKKQKIDVIECEGHSSTYKIFDGGDTLPSYTLGTCLVCRETYIESYTAFAEPCSRHSKIKFKSISEAGCKTNGLEIVYCADCGTLIRKSTTPKTNCTYDPSKQVVIASSCSINGQTIDECTVCGVKKYTTLELAPHTHAWYTVSNNYGYEYSTCSVCGTFESRKVDYSVFNMLIGQISKYYETYYAPDTVAMLKPILANKDANLTQEAVDYNVDLLRNILSNIKYNVDDLPVIFIEKEGGLSKDDYTPAKFYIAYKDDNGEYKVEAVEYNGEIKIRGNSTANATKYPYNIKFSSKVDLFDMGAGKKYSLLANLYDQTLIRNAIAIDFAQSIGLEFTSKYVMIELYYNGEFDGLYMLTTPVDVAENRVEIDEDNDFLLEIGSNHDDDKEGFMLSHKYIDVDDQNKTKDSFSEFKGLYMLVEEPEKLSAEAYSSLVSSFNQISLAIYSGDWEQIQKWVDVESMAKFYLLHDYLKAVDIGYDSVQFYIKDGKLYGGPIWDWDFAIGNKADGTGQDGGSWTVYDNSDKANLTLGTKGDSTTGFWANSLWHSGATGYFLHFYKYSPEFMDLVVTYLEEYDQEMTLLYADVRTSERETLVNSVDKFHKDPAFTEARIRNWDIYEFYKKYGVDQKVDLTYNQSIEYLKSWLEGRHNWLKEAYGVQ